MSYIFKSQKKKKKHYGIGRWLIILVVFLLVIFLGKTSWQAWQRGKDLTQTVEDLKQQKELLEEKKAELEEDIQTMDHSDYLERVAREELNLQKPGEKAIAFINPPETPSSEQETPLPWWQKCLRFFKNWFAFKR